MILRSVCLFWSKQATNILKTINILLLMTQFHIMHSKILQTWPRGRQALAIGAHNLFQNNVTKEFCFHKIVR